MMAAACKGGMANAMIGTPSAPSPPANPPLEIPVNKIAGIAMA